MIGEVGLSVFLIAILPPEKGKPPAETKTPAAAPAPAAGAPKAAVPGEYLRAYESGTGRGRWDAEARAGLGALEKGDWGAAAASLAAARKQGCADGLVLFGLATALHQAAMDAEALPLFDESIRGLERAYRSHPAFGRAHNNRGAVLERLGKYPEAIEAYRAAVEASPGHAKPVANLGRLLAACGRLDEGLEALRKAAWMDRKDTSIEWALGTVLAMRVETEREAETVFRRLASLETDPARRSAAIYDAGRIRQRAGDVRRAFQDYEEAVRLDPKNASAWLDAGRLMFASGRKEEGRKRLRKAAEAAPDRKDIAEAIRAAEGLPPAGNAPPPAGSAPTPGGGPAVPPEPSKPSDIPPPPSEALENQAANLLSKGLHSEASVIYKRIVREFPGTEAAERAEAALRKLAEARKAP